MTTWWAALSILLAAAGCDPSTTMTQLDEEQFFEPAYQTLARAVRLGTLSAIDNQLKAKLDINHVGKQNMTLLMWSIVNHNKKSLTHLLEKGANPNYKDAPLIKAIMRLFKEHVYLLLDKGADVNTRAPRTNDPAVSILAGLNQFADVAKFLERGASHTLADTNGTTLPFEVQDATPDPGTEGYEWQKKVKQLLVERGVHFPVPHPYYTKPVWLPIRERWYASPEGQSFEAKLDEVGRDPEGFGEKWRVVYRAEEEAFEAWMAKSGITPPE
ncbi:MAG: ankyrin repeat domain-containing protein [Cytophagaceae bacterium]|nr:MAG: ankyrin repeat domain-containing protein [Cytophagaceae bacterium]